MASVHQDFVFHYGCDQNQKLDLKLEETELNKENKHSQINKSTVWRRGYKVEQGRVKGCWREERDRGVEQNVQKQRGEKSSADK